VKVGEDLRLGHICHGHRSRLRSFLERSRSLGMVMRCSLAGSEISSPVASLSSLSFAFALGAAAAPVVLISATFWF